MAEEITYYAIIDEFTSRDSPRTCSAVIENDEGQSGRNVRARPKMGARPLLYAAERGILQTSSSPSAKRKLAGSWSGFGG